MLDPDRLGGLVVEPEASSAPVLLPPAAVAALSRPPPVRSPYPPPRDAAHFLRELRRWLKQYRRSIVEEIRGIDAPWPERLARLAAWEERAVLLDPARFRHDLMAELRHYPRPVTVELMADVALLLAVRRVRPTFETQLWQELTSQGMRATPETRAVLATVLRRKFWKRRWLTYDGLLARDLAESIAVIAADELLPQRTLPAQ